ncbi:MAG: Rubrerythrin [Methanomassiliicoccales archaeon PtaU1.Bin124]|nr:MAG: Rubrerythrin [Methanomassiliicoccales archaeon PtaU1.Bin124]
MKRTVQNLAKAFVGESQARNRYSMYASVARNEGYEQIAAIFIETADQEKEHAKQIFKMLQQVLEKEAPGTNELTIETPVPLVLGTTEENLKAAMAGEHMENSMLYPQIAKDADSEGYPEVAKRMRAITVAESHHEQRYGKLLKHVQEGSYFKRQTAVWWTCRECGYVHYGIEPPEVCPSCSHPKSFYQVLSEEF